MSRATLTALLIIIAGLPACAGNTLPRTLSLPADPGRAVTHVGAVYDYETAAASIAALLEHEFGFPSFPVVFYFCADRPAFERVLLNSGYEAAFARQTAETMDAVGGHRRVLLNELALAGQAWPARVASLAHELVHTVQYEWGGGERGTSDQWLREGFAEWITMRVMDRLRALRFDDARRNYTVTFRRSNRSQAPRFDEMATFRQWVAIGRRADLALYAQAFLSVDYLIERHGLAAVIGYFQLFATRQDRHGNFRKAFGEDLSAFEAALRDRIK